MRKLVSLAALMGALLLLYAGGVLAQPQTPQEKIPDRYIVVFKEGVQNPTAVANDQARDNGLQLRFVYTSAIEGYAAVFPNDRALQRVQRDPRVDYVEQDQVVKATTQKLPWGVNRVDADVSSTKAGDHSGAVTGVDAYIIDTGIYKHTDLNVVDHVNFRGDGKNYDCNGHGTHVAGTVGAIDNYQDVVGVAPGVRLTGVKVLGCGGLGPISGVVEGVDWVTGQVLGPDKVAGTGDDKTTPSIANMSLGSGPSTTLDNAVKKSAGYGVFYSIAAGNDAQPACNYSPARAGLAQQDTNGDGLINHNDSNGIVTTAATNKTDEETSWSNYGKCVDIWAPGASILSTRNGGGTTTMSGTSMAAPHVGGGGALYLSTHTSADPVAVEGALKATVTTPGTLSKAPSGARYVTLENVKTF